MSFFSDKSEVHSIDMSHVPAHIGIIMDGNGRWATLRGLPRPAGHKAGVDALQNITEYCAKIGVAHLTVYAFSTENWKRPKSEIDALMLLLSNYLDSAQKKLHDKNYLIKIIGDMEGMDKRIAKKIDHVEQLTKNNTGLNLNIAINYGGRHEIVAATKAIALEILSGTLTPQEISEQLLAKKMYTNGIPDPDLIIRPSGEQRLSNFLLWQSAYSELWFSNINWPDFTQKDMLDAIAWYQNRDRRFGGI